MLKAEPGKQSRYLLLGLFQMGEMLSLASMLFSSPIPGKRLAICIIQD
jgi:hypothetical protein